MLQSAFCDFLVTVPQRTVVCVAIAADHSVVTVIDNDLQLNQETNEPWRRKNNHTG